MKHNLRSLEHLLEKDYSMNLVNKCIELYDPDHKFIPRAPLSQNKTFRIDSQVYEFKCLDAYMTDQTLIRHYRYGHLNFKSLEKHHKDEMVHGLPLFESPKNLCEGCFINKQPRNAFKDQALAASKSPIEVTSTDVCGPFETPSIGENIYFVSF